MVFASEKTSQLTFRDFEVDKGEDVYDIIIFKAQGYPELFKYIIIAHHSFLLTVCGLAKVAILPQTFMRSTTLQIYEKLLY
jgi:hypothetical protein